MSLPPFTCYSVRAQQGGKGRRGVALCYATLSSVERAFPCFITAAAEPGERGAREEGGEGRERDERGARRGGEGRKRGERGVREGRETSLLS